MVITAELIAKKTGNSPCVHQHINELKKQYSHTTDYYSNEDETAATGNNTDKSEKHAGLKKPVTEENTLRHSVFRTLLNEKNGISSKRGK